MAGMTFSTTLLSRDILKLSGPDTKTLLQGLITVNMDRLEAGTALYGALLTPQGKILETMFLTPAGDDLYLDLPAGRGEGLAKKLMLYRLRAKVEIENVTERVTVGASPAAEDVPAGVLLTTPDPRLHGMGVRWLTEASEGLPQAEEAYLARQIALGLPDLEAGFDSAKVFPLDVNLDALNGIDHKKGCFIGQEVASRMYRKGEIRKRTYIASGDGLTAGASLKQNDRTVGEVLYVVNGNALALVRLDRLDGLEASVDDQPIQLTRPGYLS